MIRQKSVYSLKAINILVIIAMMLGGVVLDFGPVEAAAGDIVIIAPAENAKIPVKDGDPLAVQFTVDSTGKGGAGTYQILIAGVDAGTYNTVFDGSAAQPFTRTITIPPMGIANEGIQDLTVKVTFLDASSYSKDQPDAVIVDNLFPADPVLSKPNGGETIQFGVAYSITWTDSLNADETLSLYLSADNGVHWSKIVENPSVLPYEWTPSVLTTQGLIKIEVVDEANHKASDQSAAVFTIYGVDHSAPEVEMVAPSEVTPPDFIKGEYTLKASATDSDSGITGVLFQYSLGEGESWLDAGAGSYDGTNWKLDFNTASLPDGAVQFRAIATNGIELSKTSAAVETTIDNSVPVILSFNLTDGDWLKADYEFVVEASDAQSGITNLVISQLVGSEWSEVCSTVAGLPSEAGVYTLSCTPTTPLNAAATKIKAVVTNGALLTAEEIRTVQVDLVAPTVTGALLTPDDNAVLHLGDPLTIEWDTALITETNLAGIDLELQSATASNNVIASGEANDGSYNWTVSGLQSNDYQVCLIARDLAGNTAEDCNPGITIWGVDTTPPTVALDPIDDPNTGTITLSAAAEDPESGILQVQFSYKEVGDADYALITDTDPTTPYTLTWDSTSVNGEVMFKAVATNGGGVTGEHEIGPVLIDNTVPTIGELSKAGNIYKVSASDDGSGIASVVFEYKESGGTTWEEIGAGELNLVSGKYESPAWQMKDADVRAVATDKVGLFKESADYAPDFDIELKEGWNLISLPLIPDAPAIEDVLADLMARSSVKQVIGWVHEGGALISKVWDGVHLLEIDNLDPEFGYWVEMAADDTVSFDGSIMPAPPEAPRSYVVYAGWNLIGFKSTQTTMTAYTYLGEAGEGNMRSMYTFDAVNDVYEQITGGDNLTPGNGYWLAVSTNATIYPPAD